MKLNLFIKSLIMIVLLVYYSSCQNKNEETDKLNTDSIETEVISVDDFNETTEDLFTVDYKDFYDELSPYGEWIEVTDSDLGIDLSGRSTALGNDHKKITFEQLFGVNTAWAYDKSAPFFIWKPSNNKSNNYVPYTNGQWINTSNGWYFKAPTPYEEKTVHYGRWVNSPNVGWAWMPGRVWSPAWVDWKEDDNYIAWAPLPPLTYIVNNILAPPVIADDHYVVVEKRYFIEPEISKYMYKENKNKIMIKEMRRGDGIMVKEKIIINKGPDVNIFEQLLNRIITPVRIEWGNSGEVIYSDSKYVLYYPRFVKVKGKQKNNVSYYKPKKYVKYDEADLFKGSNDKNEEGVTKKNENDNKNNNKGKDQDKSNKGNNKKSDNEKGVKGNNYNKDSDYKDNKSKGNTKDDKSNDKNKSSKTSKNSGIDSKEKSNDKQNKGNDKQKGSKNDNSKGKNGKNK